MTSVPVRHEAELPVRLEVLAGQAAGYASRARAASTVRAYSSDWRHFTNWCSGHHLSPLPADPTTVALYLADLAGKLKVATLGRRLAAIAVAHKAAGESSPTEDVMVRTTWAGIRRAEGTAQVAKQALLTADIRAMVAALPGGLLGRRDACLLLLGFASALRRGELVALDVADVSDTAEGLVVTVRRSKTDQEGAGRLLGVPYGSDPATCPVRAYRAWLDASGLTQGPLFRSVNRHGRLGTERLSDRAVALVVKRAARTAGLEPVAVAGHSLRSGFASSAAVAGASERAIMEQTGHRSVTVVRRYIRRGSLFHDNPAARLGL